MLAASQVRKCATILGMKTLAVTCETLNQISLFAESGADEAVFALQDSCFSALRSFDVQQASEMIQAAHRAGMKAGILMNRLFHEGQILQASDDMRRLIEAGADHICFADMGLARAAMKDGFTDRLIYRPETMMTSTYDALTWMNTGIASVLISPLLTEEEILKICKETENASVAVHGYQLMSVSRRPLVSSYARKTGIEIHEMSNLYLKEEKRQDLMPVYENGYCTMIYTDYILESFDETVKFSEAGAERFCADSWHIEEEAMADALKIYRALLDGDQPDMTPAQYREKYDSLPLSGGYYDQKTVR